MAWEPGKSGNPGGTAGPKRFQGALDRAIAQDEGKRLRAAVEKMLDAAAAGEVWAIQFLADRLDGKATQTVSLIHDATELSDDELSSIAATGRARIAEAQDGTQKASRVH